MVCDLDDPSLKDWETTIDGTDSDLIEDDTYWFPSLLSLSHHHVASSEDGKKWTG